MASSSLAGALSSLQTSTQLLASSISILDAGVSDFPRLTKVLSQTRHFELLPTSTLANAQEDLLSELVPEVESLLARIERQVERLERREDSLRARWELQEGRLGREVAASQRNQSSAFSKKDTSTKTTQAVDAVRAKQLRQKKERLSYAVDRLQMQAHQAERKLRQSMASHDHKQSDHQDTEIDELA